MPRGIPRETRTGHPSNTLDESSDDGLGGLPPAPADLQAMMSDLAGAATSKVTVYRVVKNQPLAYVFACSPDAFSLDDLRDRYNGGVFQLFISRDGKLWKNPRVCVEPKHSAQSAEAAPSATAELAAALRDGFARQAEATQALLRSSAQAARPSFAGIDIPATIAAVAAAVTALRPPPVPMMQMQQPANQNQSIDMLLKGIELARELRSDMGGGGEDPSMMTLLRDVIKSPILAQAVAAASPSSLPTQPKQMLQQPTSIASPAGGFARETQPRAAPPESMLVHYLAHLTRKAAEGGDPALYADLVLDNLDQDALISMLDRKPTAVDALIRDYPPVAQHREWFSSLVEIIRGALEPDPADHEIIRDALEPDPAYHETGVVAQSRDSNSEVTDVSANAEVIVSG